MSDEIFTRGYRELQNANDGDEDLMAAENPNDIRLQDIEQQLEMAESRCNTLKDQLDYMKQMYGGNKSSNKSRKISNVANLSNHSSTSNEETTRPISVKKSGPSRQKSNAIETDNSGAAVRTINNILNGITNSVNRLSEIHSQITTPRAKSATSDYQKDISAKDSGTGDGHTVVIPELKLSRTSLEPISRGVKRKSNKSRTSSQITFKRTSKIEKKPRTNISRSSGVLEKKSSTIVKNKYFSKIVQKSNKLVEIYHNTAIKLTDSDDSNMKKSRQIEEKSQRGSCEVPPLNIEDPEMITFKNTVSEQRSLAKTYSGYRQNGLTGYPNNELYYDQAPRTLSCCYSKNYELPTVASRMKQVAKRYLGTLNIKTIPFCAAISTTQSHNIGINIQQVMNIIKNRQPINGISPTLAHNIGLAAEKMNCKPFSVLVSTINSRISQAPSRCPLSKTYLNFQQLQEQARNIPNEVIEEADEDIVETPEAKIVTITGPSGDMEVKTKNIPVWKMERNDNGEQCTCVPTSNITFQQVASRYQRNIRPSSDNPHSQVISTQPKPKVKLYKSARHRVTNRASSMHSDVQCQGVHNSTETENETQLQGKERNLKEVLTNLHHDFECLNTRYDELCAKTTTDNNEETMKELERLETELTKKEEEITMVMTLYKEVMALKQQVKQLKEKRSQASITTKETKTKFKEYNNPEAAFHLTKLLKQIQHYQMRYKSNLGAD